VSIICVNVDPVAAKTDKLWPRLADDSGGADFEKKRGYQIQHPFEHPQSR